MIYSCYSFHSNACQFVYDWYHAMAKHDINKTLHFLFCSKSSRFILNSSAIITFFFKMSSAESILFKCLSIFFPSPFGGLYVKIRIMFFDFLFVSSRHKDSIASQFIDKSSLVLQQKDSFTERHLPPPLQYCLY